MKIFVQNGLAVTSVYTSQFNHNNTVFNNYKFKILYTFTATQLTYLTGTCKCKLCYNV